MENGKAGQFKGKTLEEIDLNLEEDLMQEGDEENDDNNNIDELDERLLQEREVEEIDIDKIKIRSRNVQETGKENEDDVRASSNQQKPKKRILVAWTNQQKQVVCDYFKNHIKKKQPPKKGECEELHKLHPELLANKNWLKIKVFIQNKYSKS